MRSWLLGIATVAVLASAGVVNAQTLYSFETPPVNPDGFGPNGGGVTISQDTIGATNLLHSMKVDVVQGATFVGALTGVVNPAIGDPPGLNTLYFDLTVTQPFTGAFAVAGITIFGASQPGPGQQFGLQAQFADIEHIEGKGPGTYTVQIDLNSATNPLTFATGQSFNQIFGTVGSGPNDLIPTGVQLFFNKSNDAPLTVYIDNIRLSVPEPATFSLMGLGAVVLGAVGRRRRS
jgi:hypothetical protein